jgi:hypothetical protein
MCEIHDTGTLELLREYAKELGCTSLTVKELVESHRNIRNDVIKDTKYISAAISQAHKDGFEQGERKKINENLKNLTLYQLCPDMFED